MKNRKNYDDDDGRTIADMSGVGAPAPMFGGIGKKKMEQEQPEEEQTPPIDLTHKERRMYIFGALGAALLIAGAFIVGLGLAILLMLLVWNS